MSTTNAEQFLSIKLDDVENEFKNLPETGTHEKISGLPLIENIILYHVQGYTQIGDGPTYIFTHTGDSGSVIIKPSTNEDGLHFSTPGGWNHPGGIQAIGQYLFVPCEEGKQSQVVVYSLEELASRKLPRKKQLSFFPHSAGCLGITDLLIEGEPHYLLVIGDQNNYHCYLSKIPNDISELSVASFKKIGKIAFRMRDKDIKCQGFGLVTDTKNQVYMIALQGMKNPQVYLQRMKIGVIW